MPTEDMGNRPPDGPTTEEWRRLYDAALAFRDAAPWDWMTEDDLFGIHDPETGVTYYACIMGRLGELRALALYEGTEGLAGYWQIRLGPPDDPLEALALQRCLMASFEDREALDSLDRDVMKHLGVKVRGRGAWPLFRSYLPGYAPWFVTGPQARSLAAGLEQALLVARRSQEDPNLLSPPESPDSLYFVRLPAEEGEWRDARERPAPLSASEVVVAEVSVDLGRLQRLQETLPKTRGVLEMDYFLSPAGVRGEDGGRPFFPAVILAVDQKSGMILTTHPSEPGAVAQNLGEQFLMVVENLQMLPAQVQVSREDVQAFLEPFAAPLGVRVVRARRLKALEAAREEMAMFLGGGTLGLDPMSLLAELVSSLPDEEELSLPAPRRLRRTPRAGVSPSAGPGDVYQLKVTLRGARPPIWRRIQVPGDVRLDVLHHILQAAMGWHGGHLHAFEIDGENYGMPDSDLEMLDESRVRLDQLAPEAGRRFTYEYDFGDGWDHEILVEKILPPSPGVSLPLCLTGRRACPPEDSGGVWGYAGLLEALADPNHPEHKESRKWLGRSFDPEAFSCDEVNRRLKRAV